MRCVLSNLARSSDLSRRSAAVAIRASSSLSSIDASKTKNQTRWAIHQRRTSVAVMGDLRVLLPTGLLRADGASFRLRAAPPPLLSMPLVGSHRSSCSDASHPTICIRSLKHLSAGLHALTAALRRGKAAAQVAAEAVHPFIARGAAVSRFASFSVLSLSNIGTEHERHARLGRCRRERALAFARRFELCSLHERSSLRERVHEESCCIQSRIETIFCERLHQHESDLRATWQEARRPDHRSSLKASDGFRFWSSSSFLPRPRLPMATPRRNSTWHGRAQRSLSTQILPQHGVLSLAVAHRVCSCLFCVSPPLPRHESRSCGSAVPAASACASTWYAE